MTIIRLIDASADPVPVTCRRRHDPALRCAARSQTHVGVGKDLRLHAVEFVQDHEIGVNPGVRARLIRPHEVNDPVTERATLDPLQPPRPAAVSRHQLAEIWGACEDFFIPSLRRPVSDGLRRHLDRHDARGAGEGVAAASAASHGRRPRLAAAFCFRRQAARAPLTCIPR